MENKGFSLLETVISLGLWLLVLSQLVIYSKNIFYQQQKNKLHQNSMSFVQQIITETIHAPFESIISDEKKGIEVEVFNPQLKKIVVSSGNISLETILLKQAP